MASEWYTATVAELQRKGVLLVEDGNHGEYRPRPDEFVQSGIPFVRPDDLKDGRVDLSKCDKINEQAFTRIRKGVGRQRDVLLTHRATVGRLAWIGEDAPTFVANPGVTVWRSTRHDILDDRYLYYFMHSNMFMSQLWAEAGGTDTFPYVSLTQQRSLEISFPGITQQRAIASILGALDDKIELNRKMNATLEAIARAIFKSWFVDFDPVRAKAEGRRPEGMDDGTAALFPDRFGEDGLPEGWGLGSPLELATLISGGTPRTSEPTFWDGTILWASAKDVSQCQGPFLLSTERTITQRGLIESSTKIIPVFSTVVVARGATTGRFCILGADMAMNQTCYALRSRDRTDFFLFCWLAEFVRTLVHAAHGSVFDTITTRTFETASVIIPDRQTRKAFEAIVSDLFRRILVCAEESKTLAQARDTLLPRLISGRLRITDAERIVEAASP